MCGQTQTHLVGETLWEKMNFRLKECQSRHIAVNKVKMRLGRNEVRLVRHWHAAGQLVMKMLGVCVTSEGLEEVGKWLGEEEMEIEPSWQERWCLNVVLGSYSNWIAPHWKNILHWNVTFWDWI